MPRVVMEESDDDFPDVDTLICRWKHRSGRSGEPCEMVDTFKRGTGQRVLKSAQIGAADSLNDGKQSEEQRPRSMEDTLQQEVVKSKRVKKRVLKGKLVTNPLLRPLKSSEINQDKISPMKSERAKRLTGSSNPAVGEGSVCVERHRSVTEELKGGCQKETEKPAKMSTNPRNERSQSVTGSRYSQSANILKSESVDGPFCRQRKPATARKLDISQNPESFTRTSFPVAIDLQDGEQDMRNIQPSDFAMEIKPGVPSHTRIVPPSPVKGKQSIPVVKTASKDSFSNKSDGIFGRDNSTMFVPAPSRSERVVKNDTVVRERSEPAIGDGQGRINPQNRSQLDDLGEECSRIEFDDSESDDMSDFMVDDSHVSFEDDSMACPSPPPPPRSTRKLVRGRRQRSSDSSINGRKSMTSDKLPGRDSSESSLDVRDVGKEIELGDSRRTESRRGQEKNVSMSLAILSLDDHYLTSELNIAETTSGAKFTTPPGSPRLKGVKSKHLPIKQVSPHRPSVDSFWDQEAMNEWIDEYSPQKLLRPTTLDDSPIKSGAPLFSPAKIKSATKSAKCKKAFEHAKHEVAEAFLLELDTRLCQGQIAMLSEATGGVKVIWSKKLNTTAGRANWKRETVRSASATHGPTNGVTYRHHASIELAEKVIDDEHRLLNVLAHEFCHLANFMISNIKTNPHGKEFKAWAAKCTSLFGDRGIEVTTKHSYEIEYKYIWECKECGLEYKRHSKSIDVKKHRCGSCKAILIQVKPVPRREKEPGVVNAVSEYQAFMKANMKIVRREIPGSPQKDVMGLVAKRYKEFKASKMILAETDGGNSKMSHGSTSEIGVDGLVEKLDFLDLTGP